MSPVWSSHGHVAAHDYPHIGSSYYQFLMEHALPVLVALTTVSCAFFYTASPDQPGFLHFASQKPDGFDSR
jgi:hypothetical protein